MNAILTQAVPGDHIRITTDPWTEPFWQAAKDERLTAPRCGECGTFRMPPTPFCPACQGQNTQWPTLSGSGTIYSFALCHKSPFSDVSDFTYAPVIVELDDAPGIRLVSNLVGADPAAIHIGMAVRVKWNLILGGWKLPLFVPAQQHRSAGPGLVERCVPRQFHGSGRSRSNG